MPRTAANPQRPTTGYFAYWIDRLRLADDAHRRFDAGLGQAPGIADRHALHPAIRMVDRAAGSERLARGQGLLQSVQHEVGAGSTGHLPADDPPGKGHR